MADTSARAVGILEVPFYSVALVVTDRIAKAGEVRLIGFESVGDERLIIRIDGDTSSVTAALEAGEAHARALGVPSATVRLARPEAGVSALLHHPNAINPLYGGRDQCLPSDYPDRPMQPNQQAIGILETQGLAAILEATDAMLKAADVTLVGKEKIGAAYVSVVIRGDVAAVSAAIEAGRSAVGNLGKVIAAHVIARPHAEMLALLPR